jgi:hypothetical protein
MTASYRQNPVRSRIAIATAWRRDRCTQIAADAGDARMRGIKVVGPSLCTVSFGLARKMQKMRGRTSGEKHQ